MNHSPSQLPAFVYDPPQTPLAILYEDRDILVVNKPHGLLSVPGRQPEHQDSLYTRIVTQYPLAQVVHRLDMATSGVMVFALRKKAEIELKRQFRERIPKKMYYAQVAGTVTQTHGTVDAPLICDWPNRPMQKVDYTAGKASLTHYEVVRTTPLLSLVKLFPITGRSHQLRVHMQSIGHPILGDKLYGVKDAHPEILRLMLHATELQFLHPFSQEEMFFTCLPDFLKDAA
jgi:tRNA pseudouridine32 synthase / 23S rRNA pseudouridine746 synthase